MDEIIPAKQLNWLYIFIAAAAAVNFSGLFVNLMGPDAALYATIAKIMVQRHDYVNLVVNGTDWLYMPHFSFWITAISFNIFGISTWAYKLPGILFMLMGALYTYKLAKELYNKQIALWAVLILLTAQYILLANNDVRTEPYLTGLIIAAVYYFYKANIHNNYWHLLAGCVFTACAIMTMGMFAITPIGGAIAGHLIITKQWKQLFNLKWLVAIVLTIVFIFPEIWCLYRQFDMHHEKVVFGQKGVSGIKFFFWDSQFGRFYNTGDIKGGGDPFFFVHSTLCAFLPWSLLLFVAIFRFIKTGIKNVLAQEWYCISAALLTFVLLSVSSFQLPHYMNIVFTFFAIITARYLYHVQLPKNIKAIRITQVVIIILMLLVVCALQYFFFPILKWPVIVAMCIIYLIMVFLPDSVSTGTIPRVFLSTAMASFIINLYLNLAFYPTLLKYQGTSEAALWLNRPDTKKYPVAQCETDAWPMEFYLQSHLTYINPDTVKAIPKNTFYLYASPEVVKQLTAKGWSMQEVYEQQRYPITHLNLNFLNRNTRKNELNIMEIVEVNSKEKPIIWDAPMIKRARPKAK